VKKLEELRRKMGRLEIRFDISLVSQIDYVVMAMKR